MPAIVNSVTLATINCVGSTAMAGAVGAGGLGSVALNYGFYSFNDLVLYTSVIITLIIVQLIQLAGSLLYTDVSENNHVLYILYGYINKNNRKRKGRKNEKNDVTASERNDGT